MVKITTNVINRLDIEVGAIPIIEANTFDSDNNATVLQRTLTHVKSIEDQASSRRRELVEVSIIIGTKKIFVHSSRELSLVIDSIHAYAWALANDI